MQYHFNPHTGQSNLCKAKARSCPYFHGNTPEEASKKYENYYIAHLGRPLEGVSKKNKEALLGFPSNVLRNKDLKELDAAQLVQTLRHEAILAGMEGKVVDSAIDLASVLHAHQTRINRGKLLNLPYIEHPLRNSLRLLRWGIKDQNVIVSAMLHDVVEDSSKIFVKLFYNKKVSEDVARKLLEDYIKDTYGVRVQEIVKGVTNEYIPYDEAMKLSPEEKINIYFEHIKENIKDKDVCLNKLSDFTDNAVGLYHNDLPERQIRIKKQAAKYIPVIPLFEDALDKMDLGLPQEKILYIKEQLSLASVRLKEIVERPID